MAHYVRTPAGSTSKSSDKFSSATVQRGVSALGAQVANNMGQGDINRTKGYIAGNDSDAVVQVTFRYANRDQFVGHRLGYRVDNFTAESPSEPARFSMGSKAPTIFGMWLRSDTAGVTARIRMHGQRQARG